MSIRCGIVGLPNVGKSTLFNALTSSIAAEAANYPFCTIEPNIGRISVPDSRLDKLAAIAGSKAIIATQIEFVDIAGLVRGASKGEGLGNQFLGHIREVDCIVYVLRCFEDGNITHVEGRVDPISDAEIIEMELILSDLQSLTKRQPNLEKKAKHDKDIAQQLELVIELIKVLDAGKTAYSFMNEKNKNQVKELQLLTSKPVLYVCNVSEEDVVSGNALSAQVEARAKALGGINIIVSAQIEQEISALTALEERHEFLASLGLKESGLSRLVRCSYDTLGLITFFTIGPKEAHAWTIHKGATAPQAAGVIHTDFEKGFICAETIGYEDYITYTGEAGAREAGKFRLEGKEYIVRDGDVIHFRFNV